MRWVMVSAVVVAEEKEKESYVLAGCGNVSGQQLTRRRGRAEVLAQMQP